MKLARFRAAGRARYGRVEGDLLREVRGSPFRGDLRETGKTYRLSDVVLLPVTVPRQLVGGVGINYYDHAAQGDEMAGKRLSAMGVQPFFTSNVSLTGSGSPIVITREAREVHYEGELVVVIGRKARHVSKEQALDYVLGYTCGNDVSEKGSWERDFSLWRAKGLPTWSPVGPWIVTDIAPGNLDITVRVNGQVHHTFNTRNMVHDVPTIVSFLSQYTTLYPGDLIFTGTSGTTRAMKPEDVAEVEISGIGTLRNPVVAERG
ncbi:MAG: fumarylacetoacetate hydrolase family protein [Chloroflexi bacterium]|nr:fumarylacetoacetate hydrolase family protein [Chloroflexota bacterium]